jgi:hypothetical protein
MSGRHGRGQAGRPTAPCSIGIRPVHLKPWGLATVVLRMPAWPFALTSLPLAFAVAQGTGVRPLGGLVLVLLAAAAVLTPGVERRRAALWVAILLVCFAASHVLADPLGTWGAVALVTVVTGFAGVLLLDHQGSLRPAVD